MIQHTPKSGQLFRLQGRNLLARRISDAQTEILDALVNLHRYRRVNAFGPTDAAAMARLDLAIRCLEQAKGFILGETEARQ